MERSEFFFVVKKILKIVKNCFFFAINKNLLFLLLSAIGRTLIPRYFRSIFEGGVTELYYNMKHPKESFHNTSITLDCDHCVMVTHHAKPMFTKVRLVIFLIIFLEINNRIKWSNSLIRFGILYQFTSFSYFSSLFYLTFFSLNVNIIILWNIYLPLLINRELSQALNDFFKK